MLLLRHALILQACLQIFKIVLSADLQPDLKNFISVRHITQEDIVELQSVMPEDLQALKSNILNHFGQDRFRSKEDIHSSILPQREPQKFVEEDTRKPVENLGNSPENRQELSKVRSVPTSLQRTNYPIQSAGELQEKSEPKADLGNAHDKLLISQQEYGNPSQNLVAGTFIKRSNSNDLLHREIYPKEPSIEKDHSEISENLRNAGQGNHNPSKMGNIITSIGIEDLKGPSNKDVMVSGGDDLRIPVHGNVQNLPNNIEGNFPEDSKMSLIKEQISPIEHAAVKQNDGDAFHMLMRGNDEIQQESSAVDDITYNRNYENSAKIDVAPNSKQYEVLKQQSAPRAGDNQDVLLQSTEVVGDLHYNENLKLRNVVDGINNHIGIGSSKSIDKTPMENSQNMATKDEKTQQQIIGNVQPSKNTRQLDAVNIRDRMEPETFAQPPESSQSAAIILKAIKKRNDLHQPQRFDNQYFQHKSDAHPLYEGTFVRQSNKMPSINHEKPDELTTENEFFESSEKQEREDSNVLIFKETEAYNTMEHRNDLNQEEHSGSSFTGDSKIVKAREIQPVGDIKVGKEIHENDVVHIDLYGDFSNYPIISRHRKEVDFVSNDVKKEKAPENWREVDLVLMGFAGLTLFVLVTVCISIRIYHRKKRKRKRFDEDSVESLSFFERLANALGIFVRYQNRKSRKSKKKTPRGKTYRDDSSIKNRYKDALSRMGTNRADERLFSNQYLVKNLEQSPSHHGRIPQAKKYSEFPVRKEPSLHNRKKCSELMQKPMESKPFEVTYPIEGENSDEISSQQESCRERSVVIDMRGGISKSRSMPELKTKSFGIKELISDLQTFKSDSSINAATDTSLTNSNLPSLPTVSSETTSSSNETASTQRCHEKNKISDMIPTTTRIPNNKDIKANMIPKATSIPNKKDIQTNMIPTTNSIPYKKDIKSNTIPTFASIQYRNCKPHQEKSIGHMKY